MRVWYIGYNLELTKKCYLLKISEGIHDEGGMKSRLTELFIKADQNAVCVCVCTVHVSALCLDVKQGGTNCKHCTEACNLAFTRPTNKL